MNGNHRWLMQQIHRATTLKQLEQVLVDIKSDQFENEPWTKDKTKVSRLRHYYASRKEQIK